MAKYYPHRQTVIIAIACAVAIAGTVAYVHWQTPPIRANQPDIAATVPRSSHLDDTVASSSNDWQKQFFGTATGTSTVLGGKTAQVASDTPLTLTDQLSRELFSRFIDLKQNDLDGNPQLVQDSVDQTIDDTTTASAQPKTYDMTDLAVSNQSDVGSLRAYGNAVAVILLSYMPRSDAAAIASDAFDKDDLDLLSNIDPIITAYRTTIVKLLAMPVPQALAQYHLDLVNSVSSMLFVSQGLRNIQGDPTQSIIALGTYSTAQDAFHGALLNMKNYFAITNISFSTNEPGTSFSTI